MKTLSIYLLDLLVMWGVGGCAPFCLKIPKIVLGNDLSFPGTFTFDVPQSWVSKAGREGSEVTGVTLHILTSLFPNSAPPLISSSHCHSWDRQIWDSFCVVTTQNQRQPLAWVSPPPGFWDAAATAREFLVPKSALLTSPWWVCSLQVESQVDCSAEIRAWMKVNHWLESIISSFLG